MAGEISEDVAVLQLEARELVAAAREALSQRLAAVEAAVTQLASHFSVIPEHQCDSSAVSGFLRECGLPQQFTMRFAPPSSVQLVGSFALQATTTSVADVAVQLPRSCLLLKDQINFRYHSRRAVYLAVLARYIAGGGIAGALNGGGGGGAAGGEGGGARMPGLVGQPWLGCFAGDPARPVLLLRLQSPASVSSSAEGVVLRLLPVVAPDAFALGKLAPDRNNVRWVVKHQVQQQQQQQRTALSSPAPAAVTATAPPSAVAAAAAAGESGAGDGGGKALATPHYNAGVLQDALGLVHAQLLRRALTAEPALGDALLLLKAWARSAGIEGGGGGGDDSGLGSGGDALGGHLLAMLLLHAVACGGVPVAAAAPLQLVRTALTLLADDACWRRGLAMARPPGLELNLPPPPPLQVFCKHYAVVFVDPTGWLNLAANLSRSTLTQGQAAARRALALLTSPPDANAAFAAIFLSPAPPAAQATTASAAASGFDCVWTVMLPAGADAGGCAAGASAPPGHPCGDVPGFRRSEARVEQLVRQALGSRATLVRALPRPLAPPGGGANAASALAAGAAAPPAALLVGACLDPAAAARLVDVGPAADDAAAAARFRALWGERADLRRFQDGRICEAVVWSAPPGERHTIPDLAVRHILARHLPPGAAVRGSSAALDAALRQPAASGGGGGEAGLAASRALDAALLKLSKQLLAVEGLALKPVAVQPLGAASRHTAPFAPAPHPLAGGGALEAATAGHGARLARCLDAVEVMVQLEGSGRWPDDPAAYAKMKAALGVQLAGALESGFGLRTAASEECVDVFTGGFAFRLLLYTERDAAVAAKAAAAAAPPPARPTPSSTPPPKALPLPRPLALSHHHGLIAALEGENAAFGPACRLARRWVGTQLLGNHLAGEAVELLVAAAFTGPSLRPPPASRAAGLLRFLQLLASFPWAHAPLLVDPQREATPALQRRVNDAFEAAQRSGGMAPAMFVATPRDPCGCIWTQDRPSRHVLQRAVLVAAQSALRLQALLCAQPDPEVTPDAVGSDPGPGGHQVTNGVGGGDSDNSGGAWRGVFEAQLLGSFDALVVLRAEALPHAGRAPPGAAKRLRRVLRAARGRGGGGKRARDEMSAALGDVADGDDVSAGAAAPPAKQARAVLGAFPRAVVASLPTDKLLPELLVGFDPVKRYCAALEERYGHLATFCADPEGGSSVVGVKWRPEAFVPQPLRLSAAHGMLEVALTGGDGGGGSGSVCVVVPNVAQILWEVQQLGTGLVEEVVLL